MRKYAAPLILLLCCASAVAAIAVPNFLNALNRARQKRTMADMRTIGTAWEARATDLNAYLPPLPGRAPASADAADFEFANNVSFEELERALIPTYARSLPRRDDWKNDFDFRAGSYVDGSAQSYAIRSRGSDGRAERQRYTLGTITEFENDLVFSVGNFVQYPEGICSQ